MFGRRSWLHLENAKHCQDSQSLQPLPWKAICQMDPNGHSEFVPFDPPFPTADRFDYKCYLDNIMKQFVLRVDPEKFAILSKLLEDEKDDHLCKKHLARGSHLPLWGCTCPAEGGGRGAADLFCVAGAIVLEVGKDRFPAVTVSSNILVKQLPRRSACFPRRSGCHFVTCISSVFQDVLHATLQQPFQATSKTFCVLRCNNLFNQLPPWSACYVVTSVSKIFQDALDATL